MEAAGAMNRVVKKEVEVKPEVVECAVCLSESAGAAELRPAALHFLAKFAMAELDAAANKYACHACLLLVNDLEQAEIEYLKLKEAFESVISKNPLFNQPQNLAADVKVEFENEQYNSINISNNDSEDEPLAVTKKKRGQKGVKRKKRVFGTARRGRPPKKRVSVEKWSCAQCGARGEGGAASLAAHQLTAHAHHDAYLTLHHKVKKEVLDSSEGGLLNTCIDSLKVELVAELSQNQNQNQDDDVDDDDDDFPDDNYLPEEPRAARAAPAPRRAKLAAAHKHRSKTVHQCADCDAKFTSVRRFEQHQEKHAEGKPPFICEVCGARYKHKRACDIHVALHKGISDWKCEECDKLFPSKGALQRHNNIHTGKLNYQCDLCGKSFIHTSSFKMHKLSHSGVKPHSCDVCGLALMTRSHLKRHKRVHSGEKRHECAVCGKRFSERYNLAAHSKSHEAAAGAGAGAGEAAAAPPRRRLFRCPYCAERYERRYMLERHVSAAHGRTLERAPPTPRNTMSKLLKAQAQARTPLTPHTPLPDDAKVERSPEPRAPPPGPQKLQLASTTSTVAMGSWSGVYAAEFGLRADYPHAH